MKEQANMDIYDWATDDYYGQRAEELRNGAEVVRFTIFVKTCVPAVKDFEANRQYQDATKADWDSGKFHS